MRRDTLLLSLCLLLGAAIQVWAALQWPANFDSDEAIVGLMSLHMREGQWTPYFYGQQYMGSLMALAGAGMMTLLGPTVPALRVTDALLYGLFLALSYALAWRVWGRRSALLAVALLALPPYLVLYWTYRPSVNASLLLCLGTALLLLTLPSSDPKGFGKPLGSALAGLAAGLGLWTHPMMVIYLAAAGLPWLLQTPEWRAVYRPISARPALRVAAPLVTLGLVGLATLAFFAGACAPVGLFGWLRLGSRLVLLGAVGVTALAFLWASRRRKTLLTRALALGLGFLVGNLPQWGAWVWLGIAPSTARLPACPTDAVDRARLVFLEMFPILWGVVWPNPFGLPVSGAAARITLATAGLMLIVIGGFAWRERHALRSLVALAPTPAEGMAGQTLILLLIVPVALTLLGSNSVDRYAARYLLPSWQGGLLMLAALAGDKRLAWRGRRGVLVAAVVIGWAAQVAVGYQVLSQFWTTRPYTPAAVAELEGTLRELDVSGGYADYWLTYPVTFLTHERIVITPFNGVDRLPLNTQRIGAMPTLIYLLPVGALDAEQSTLADLVAYLRYPHEAGPASATQTSDLVRQTLVARRTVAHWDVWIVRQ